MAQPPPTKEWVEFAIETIKRHGGNRRAAARELGLPETSLWNRIDCGSRLYGTEIPPSSRASQAAKGRRELQITDGVIYVGSDAHYWPGEPSTAHKAFVKFIKREKNLRAVVMNGDAYDFPNISRHDVDWTETPATVDELEVVSERLGEIEKASGKAKRYWPLGNHDARFERYLAKNAPEMKGVRGSSLVDHNPLWEPCYSLFINDGPGGTVIKHRFKGGIHAAHNNAVTSGRSMVTGHLHSQKVTPWTDYNGTRWGVDTGCMADPFGPQFSYCEDNPRNWRSGFARLKWVNGNMLTPELVRVVENGTVEFRGELIEV